MSLGVYALALNMLGAWARWRTLPIDSEGPGRSQRIKPPVTEAA